MDAYLETILAIFGEILISYLAGFFFFIGKRNFKYLKLVLPKKKDLHTILLYYYYVNRAIFGIIGYSMMTTILIFGIYVHDKYVSVGGIANILLAMNYVLFFAVGYSDARRVLKFFN